jgi:hypothetical protein
MVAGLVPEVRADGEDGAAETVDPIVVCDEAVAWRQKSGALISGEFALGSTDAHATVHPISLLKLKWCAGPVSKNMLPGML